MTKKDIEDVKRFARRNGKDPRSNVYGDSSVYDGPVMDPWLSDDDETRLSDREAVEKYGLDGVLDFYLTAKVHLKDLRESKTRNYVVYDDAFDREPADSERWICSRMMVKDLPGKWVISCYTVCKLNKNGEVCDQKVFRKSDAAAAKTAMGYVGRPGFRVFSHFSDGTWWEILQDEKGIRARKRAERLASARKMLAAANDLLAAENDETDSEGKETVRKIREALVSAAAAIEAGGKGQL